MMRMKLLLNFINSKISSGIHHLIYPKMKKKYWKKKKVKNIF